MVVYLNYTHVSSREVTAIFYRHPSAPCASLPQQGYRDAADEHASYQSDPRLALVKNSKERTAFEMARTKKVRDAVSLDKAHEIIKVRARVSSMIFFRTVSSGEYCQTIRQTTPHKARTNVGAPGLDRIFYSQPSCRASNQDQVCVSAGHSG